MKLRIRMMVFMMMIMLTSVWCKNDKSNGSPDPQTNDGARSQVFFSSRISPEEVRRLYNYIGEGMGERIAIKVHFGEEGNQNFIPASMIELLCKELGATLVETNVLYGQQRGRTDSHIALAKRHGFGFAPIDILDSAGNMAFEHNGKHFSKVYAGSHFLDYDSYLIFSHFKGHGSAGFGGAIKNISMGLASKEGKRFLHRGNYPVYDADKCIECGICVPECPENAITIKPVDINHLDCIACGMCISVCPVKVFKVPPESDKQESFLERLVEYADVLSRQRKMVYINVLANISSACDCFSRAPKPFLPDIGILASTDIVAIEKASHDLVDKAHNCDDAFLKEISVSGKHQIVYAHQLKMGNIDYELIDINAGKDPK